MSTEDDALTIALAEYAHLSDLRNQLEQKSSNRFNFFLALSTATAAVTAGLLVQDWDGPVVIWTVSILGLMVLVFGYSLFLRQVRFTAHNVRLTAAQVAIRTYLARRAPDLRPYLYLPVEGDRGVLPRGSMNWLNQSLGLPGITALLNSSLLALAVGLVLNWVAVLAFLGSLIIQIGYIGRARASWTRDIDAINRSRGIVGE